MSLPGWFDLSTNANKLRNSYLKGFLDISGGSVMLRSDNSMNFFKGESTTPKFSIGPDDITAPGPDLTPVKVSTQSIGYLTGLTQNVQSFINALQNNNDTDLKVANINATDSTLSGNLSIAQTLVVGGNANFRSNVLIEGDAEILGNEYVHKALIVGGNCTIDGSLIVKGDVSMGDFHLEGSTISAANQLDVGGNIVASASLNFSRMQLNSNFVVVPNISGNANVSVDVSSISCLKNLTSNVQAFIDAATTGESNFAEVTVENQTVNGNLTIGSTLVVGGNAAFRANVLIEGDAEIMGNEYVHKALIVGGNCTIDGSLIVKGDVSMNDYHFSGSTISAANDVNVGGELSVTGDSAFANDLTVGGHLTVKSITIGVAGDNSSADENSITFNQPFYVASDVSFGTTLNVDALATLHSASVTNDASVGGNLSVTGSYTSAAGDFTLTSGNVSAAKITSTDLATLHSASVTNNASVGGNVAVTGSYTSAAGDFTLTSGNVSANKMTSTGLATLHSASVTNNASVGGNVAVTGSYTSAAGDFTLTSGNVSANKMTSTGLATLESASVTNNASVGGDVTVTGSYNSAAGNFTLTSGNVSANKITSTGLATLESASVTNNASVGGNVSVTGSYTSAAGDFTLTSGNVSANKIASTGLATLHSASVTNDASVGGNVTVTGNYASTAGNVSAYDITASHDLKVGAMTMNTYNTVEGDVNATLISTTGSNLYLQASGANGRVVVSNDLKVEGNVTFTGTYTTINTTIEATKMFDISNNGTGVTLEVGQEDLTTDIAYFMQGNFPVMKILKQRQIAIGRADASTNYLLDVCGNVYLREKLTVDNIANFASAVNVSGKLTTGSFECNDTLTITGTSTFAADVAVNAKLTTTTFESTGIATFGDDATFNDNMYLSGAGNFDMTGSSGFLVQFA